MTAMTADSEAGTPGRQPWTREKVLDHCRSRTMTNVEHLSKITGFGMNQIYEAIAAGDWTATRVFRVGRAIRIPTSDVLTMLGLTHEDGSNSTGEPPDPITSSAHAAAQRASRRTSATADVLADAP